MYVRKIYIEWIILSIIFTISFFNQITLLVSLLVMVVALIYQREIGALKILNLITFRSVISTGLAVSISRFEILKWLIIFLVSGYLIIVTFKMNKKSKKKLKFFLEPFILFTIYAGISSFFFSNLPTIAVFKVISYSVPFYAIIVGVESTKDRYDWIKWMNQMFLFLTLPSLLFLHSPIGYLTNGVAFQGIVNHPNLFGVIMVISFSFLLTDFFYRNEKKKSRLILMLITIYLIILTKSRTSLISSFILLVTFLYFLRFKNKYIKIYLYLFLTLLGILYISVNSEPLLFIKEFLYKGQEAGDLLYSRESQIEGLLMHFKESPIFGNGFGVPVVPFKSYSLKLDAIVEPGNLILAILSYSGIIGAILFFTYITKMILMNKKNIQYQIYLPLASLLISTGEMVFFSTNNIGIWLYMCWAIYISYDKGEKNKLKGYKINEIY